MAVLSAAAVLVTAGLALWPSAVPKPERDEIDAAIRNADFATLAPCSVASGKGESQQSHFRFDEAKGVRIDNLNEIASVFRHSLCEGRLLRIRGFGADYGIRLHQKDGKTFDIVVCFWSRNMNVTDGGLRIIEMPRPWESRLRALFRRYGFNEHLK